MSRRTKLAATALLFVLFGWLYIHTGRLPGHARALELELEGAARAAVAESGEGEWAQVALDGRRAVVRGIAPDETARGRALAAVKAAGSGGIVRVADETDLRMVASPYTFAAHLEGTSLRLMGYAPDRATRAAIAERAEGVFAGDVDPTGLQVASGVPEGADWLSGVDFALRQLVRLQQGDLEITGAQMHIAGVAATAEVRADVRRQLRQAPAPFDGKADIVSSAAGDAPAAADDVSASSAAPAAPAPSPAPAPGSRAACQSRIDAVLSADTVRFGFNDSTISPESLAMLDRVAGIARECGNFALHIAGHTDATGDPAFNRALSEQRARAVRDYLASRGLDPAGLEAEGFGSADPVASNDTAEGRARNRRIEIEVIERSPGP